MKELIERLLGLGEPIVTAFGDQAERANRLDARQLFRQLTDLLTDLLEAHPHPLVCHPNDASDV